MQRQMPSVPSIVADDSKVWRSGGQSRRGRGENANAPRNPFEHVARRRYEGSDRAELWRESVDEPQRITSLVDILNVDSAGRIRRVRGKKKLHDHAYDRRGVHRSQAGAAHWRVRR